MQLLGSVLAVIRMLPSTDFRGCDVQLIVITAVALT